MEHIDMPAPDIYEQESYRFEKICDSYNAAGNALFIPESSRNHTSACNMFYAVARGAVGCATFGSESCLDNEGALTDSAVPVRDSNAALMSIMPLVLKHRNTGKMYLVLRHSGQDDEGYEFEEFLGNVHFSGEKTDEKGDFVTDRIRNGDEAFFGGFWVTPNCGVVRVLLL